MEDEPEDVEDRWEHWLVHLLWAVSVRTSALGEAALAETPLTLAGLGLLENVNARPGITIAEIARRAPQTQQALSQIAARLDRLGYLERRLAAGGRGVGLHLSPAGARARVPRCGPGARVRPGRPGRLGGVELQVVGLPLRLPGRVRLLRHASALVSVFRRLSNDQRPPSRIKP